MLADAQPEEHDIGDVTDAAAMPIAHVTRLDSTWLKSRQINFINW